MILLLHRAIEWCRKYGIRIELDLHTVPGSQNGLNHSGKLGTVNWMHGVMGIVNAQRTLNYVRSLTEFISQDLYANVIPIFMPVNEPMGYTTGIPELESMSVAFPPYCGPKVSKLKVLIGFLHL